MKWERDSQEWINRKQWKDLDVGLGLGQNQGNDLELEKEVYVSDPEDLTRTPSFEQIVVELPPGVNSTSGKDESPTNAKRAGQVLDRDGNDFVIPTITFKAPQ